jgi:arginine N-succinyltransferase
MIAYELRAALPSDEDQLLEVAGFLNTVNLPNDRQAIRDILDTSHRSFTGEIKDPKRREYVFVLRDVAAQRVIGTSMIIAQLGRRDAPYIYFDVLEEEKYSASLDKHFAHTVLRIGYSYNGPTEIGGLILLPEYRRVPERLGQSLSYIRFLYIATHRTLFRDEVLAELLPPLESDGTSYLWEALGRHFTDMSYAEADRLSKKNKEFIKQLFPEGVVYASVLSAQAREVIGKVGAQTRGVEKLLRRIGFRYAHRVDPFDGGPHFTAMTDEITLVQATRRGPVHRIEEPPKGKGLIGVETRDAPFFRAVLGPLVHERDATIVGADAAAYLGLAVGDEALTLPLELALRGPGRFASVACPAEAPKRASGVRPQGWRAACGVPFTGIASLKTERCEPFRPCARGGRWPDFGRPSRTEQNVATVGASASGRSQRSLASRGALASASVSEPS